MSNDTDADLTALIADVRAKAEWVNDPRNFPAPWTVREPTDDEFEGVGIAALVENEGGKGEVVDWTDPELAAYFARMDPATTLRLVDAVERLTRERDDARAENEQPHTYRAGIEGARFYSGFTKCPKCHKTHAMQGSRFDLLIECPEPCGHRFYVPPFDHLNEGTA